MCCQYQVHCVASTASRVNYIIVKTWLYRYTCPQSSYKRIGIQKQKPKYIWCRTKTTALVVTPLPYLAGMAGITWGVLMPRQSSEEYPQPSNKYWIRHCLEILRIKLNYSGFNERMSGALNCFDMPCFIFYIVFKAHNLVCITLMMLEYSASTFLF